MSLEVPYLKKLLPGLLSTVAVVNVLDGYTSYLLATLGKGFEANILFSDFVMAHSLEYFVVKVLASLLIIIAAMFIAFRVNFKKWQVQVIVLEAVVAIITLAYCVVNNVLILLA